MYVSYILKGSFHFGPSEKKLFLWFFYEIINKDIDIEFVKFNKHTLEIHLKKIHLHSSLHIRGLFIAARSMEL